MKQLTYALIHSPLVGPLTWELVQHEMAVHGFGAITPALTDDPNSNQPYWQQHAGSAAREIAKVPSDRSIVLVAHSGAGVLLPAIRQMMAHSIHAYVFVDAGLPINNLSRLDLMRLQDPQWAEQFHQSLLQGGTFPTWRGDDLREVIPNDGLRLKMVNEIHPRSLDFFSEPIPVFARWPDALCTFIKFSSPYSYDFEQAREAGWKVRELEAGHFHMLVEPVAVTNAIIESVEEMDHSKGG